MSGRNASPPHPSADAADNTRRDRHERTDDLDGHGGDRRPSRDRSPSPREDSREYPRPSRRSYSRSRSPQRDRNGQSKGGKNGRNSSRSPVRDRDRTSYYDSDSPPPRGSHRRGSRYRSRSRSVSSRGRSRSRSPGRYRRRRDRDTSSRSHRYRDRKRHRYDSRSRSRSPIRNGNGGYDDDESRSSRSPPRRRTRYDSRSPDARGRYGRRAEYERGSRRNRDRDRRDRRSRIGRGPFFDYQATQSLFVAALDSVAERHNPPFNVSIVNDRMRQLDRTWDIANSDFKRFADLCHEMHRRGVLEVDRVRETICVTRFLSRMPADGRLDESRRREDDHRFDRGNRGPSREEYRWKKDDKGNYSRELITDEDRRNPSRDARTRADSEEPEDRKTSKKEDDPTEKKSPVNGEDDANLTSDEKEVKQESEVSGEKDGGSTEMEGVSTNPGEEAEKDNDANKEGEGGKNGDADENENDKEEEVVKSEGENVNGMDVKEDMSDVGNTELENNDKEHNETNGVAKKEAPLHVEQKECDAVVTTA